MLYVAIHTHPACGNFSNGDLTNFTRNQNLRLLTVVGHDGHVYAAEKTCAYVEKDAVKAVNRLNVQIDKLITSDLSDLEVLEEATKLISASMEEWQNYGVKFYG